MVHLMQALLFHTPRYILHWSIYNRYVLSTYCIIVDSHNGASCQFIEPMVHHVVISTSCGNQSTFTPNESPLNRGQYYVRIPFMQFYSFLITHCSQPAHCSDNTGGVSLKPLANKKKEKNNIAALPLLRVPFYFAVLAGSRRELKARQYIASDN